MLVNFTRITKSSAKNFTRNLWLSLATFMVMVIALFCVGSLILLNFSSETLVNWVKDNIEVNAYFKDTAEEEDIFTIKEKLENREDVKSVTYISRDEALDIFKDQYKDNPTILEALDAVGANPLQASLKIQAYDLDSFPEIHKYIDNLPDTEDVLASVVRNEELTNNVDNVAEDIRVGAIILAAVFGVLVLLVTYNTIRLAIYTSRDEIHIMKLVGASNWFIRGPFIITGVSYGIFSSVITIGALLAITWQINDNPPVSFREIGLDLYMYLISNIVYIYSALLVSGVLLGFLSSYFAVKRYLKV